MGNTYTLKGGGGVNPPLGRQIGRRERRANVRITLKPTLPQQPGPDGRGWLWVGTTDNGEKVAVVVTAFAALDGRPAPQFTSWLSEHAPLRGLVGAAQRWRVG
jgi:hypothetical protein